MLLNERPTTTTTVAQDIDVTSDHVASADPTIKRAEPTPQGNVPTPRPEQPKLVQQGLQRFQRLSLRTKATLFAMAISIVPLGIFGTLAYVLTQQATTEKVVSFQNEETVGILDKLNRFIYERYGDVQVLANLPIFTNAKLSSLTTTLEKQRLLDQYAATYKVYDSIALFDLAGNPIAQTSGAPLSNHRDRDYFQAVLRTNRPVISAPQVSKSTGEPSIHFAAPVKDVNTGRTIGVMRTRLNISSLDPVIANFGQEDVKEYHVFDASGKIFMATEKKHIGNKATSDLPGLDKLLSTGKPGHWITYDATQTTDEILVSFASTTAFQDMPNLQWGIAYATYTKEAFKAQRNLLFSLVLGATATAAAVAAISIVLTNRATRPIRQAAEAVEQIGQGDLSTRLAVEGEDELATLGTNINLMASQIETLVENQRAEADRIEKARQEARQEADTRAAEQQKQKEFLQKRALELLMEVDPVSKGDLTIRAAVTPDEIGTIADSYNAIIRSLRQLVQQVQSASTAVSDTATTNESAVSSLSGNANQQMEAIAVALNQIKAMATSIDGVANRAKQAEAGVRQAGQTIQAGDEAMNRTVSGISAIRTTVSETAKKVKRLGEASQKISKVVNLISNFAAQTNLLALNAAIEAARAGEEGRGFAVVAEEVRSLAQQSASATADIEQLVEEIQSQTNEVVAAMESGTEQVVVGTQLVEETREQLAQIGKVSAQINQLVKEISQATAMQTKASTTMTETMQSVAQIANSTSQQSETVAQSFSHLVEVAQDLQVSVAQFKVG